MSEKPSIGADLLMTLWVICVCVVYYGGYFQPNSIGILTGRAVALYSAILFITVVVVALRYLSPKNAAPPSVTETERDDSA